MFAFITVDGDDYNDDDNDYGDYGDDCLKLVSLIFAVNVQNNYKISALLCSITLLSPTLGLLLPLQLQLLTTDTDTSRWNSKDRSTHNNNNNRQLLSSLCTEKAVNENVIKASIARKTLHNFKHVYTRTSQHAIVYTVISTNTTRYTLYSCLSLNDQ